MNEKPLRYWGNEESPLAEGADFPPEVPSSAEDKFIEVRDVSLTYLGQDGRQTNALEGVSFDVLRDEFVSVIGPSGCGKTTLLRLLGDLLQPSRGRIVIDGQAPKQLRRGRSIGYMFQDAVLLPWRNVHSNISLLSQVARKNISEQGIRSLARLVGIEEFLHHYPHELSGGMKQRAAIARTLALDPLVLLMDEPFGALDAINRERMNTELSRIWTDTPKTVVFVTHSIAEAVFLSDRVLVMHDRPGRIVADIAIEMARPRPTEARFLPEATAYVQELHELLRSGREGTLE